MAEHGDRAGWLVKVHLETGILRLSQSRYAEARQHFERGRVTAQQISDRRSEATATGMLGVFLGELGRYTMLKNVRLHREIVEA